MRNTFRLRFGLLVTAIFLVAGGMLWVMQYSWRCVTRLERKLTSGQIESFHLAEDLESRLLSLNNSVLRFAARREDARWDEFDQASTNLDKWIDKYDPRSNPNSILVSERERSLLQQLNTDYDDYLIAARNLRTNQMGAIMSAEAYDQLKDFQKQAQHLLELNSDLAAAHHESEQNFIHEANRSLGLLQGLLGGAVAVTLALMGALAVVIYRDQVAPLQIKLVQSQAVLAKQEKLATLGTLAAGIAHEIRNPLTSIKARLYTLDKHLESPTMARVDADVINSEITRLERIVQEVLNFARPSEPQLKTIRVATVLEEVHALMSSNFENERIRLVLDPSPDVFVSADAPHLKQVLINLVRNAAEAIIGDGTITLRTRLGHGVLQGRETATVIIEVSDTGCGIPADIEKRLFDPFFSTKATGTGLGLSIAARIVEKHGGMLQYQTRVGHGTTFGIVLPQPAVPLPLPLNVRAVS